MAVASEHKIRDRIVDIIEGNGTFPGLTPVRLAGTLFTAHRVGGDFRTWADENPAACLRRFESRLAPSITGGVSNTDVEWRWVEIETVVAYPRTFGSAGEENERSIDLVIAEDQRVIQNAIGLSGYGNFATSGAPFATFDKDRSSVALEESANALFLVFRFTYGFVKDLQNVVT